MGMTVPDEPSTRTLRLRLRSTPAPAQLDALHGLSPPPEVRHSGLTLEIEYQFPSLCTVEIWEALVQAGIADQLATGSRLRCRVAAWLEWNERERLTAPRGWRHCAREIHARYFERQRLKTGDARRQRWQKREPVARD